jgi:hypothetical protein
VLGFRTSYSRVKNLGSEVLNPNDGVKNLDDGVPNPNIEVKKAKRCQLRMQRMQDAASECFIVLRISEAC